VLSPVIGLLVTVTSAMHEHCRSLDFSVEKSGPHDFAVRFAHRSSVDAKASIASHSLRS
jgi:hypothetical protein